MLGALNTETVSLLNGNVQNFDLSFPNVSDVLEGPKIYLKIFFKP